MIKRERGFRLIVAALLAALLACASCAQAESADPIRVGSLSNPQTIVSEQDVEITIRIFNSSQTDIEGEIRLYGPDGYTVDVYQGLGGEQSLTYTGTWHVTQDQIDEGRIKYFIKYSVDEGSDAITRTIPVAIQSEAAAPQLSASYTVTPAAAHEGQQVTFAYTLSNTGNVELRNIVIDNPGVTQEKVTVASLSVGEKVTKESMVTMGDKELISSPTVTYQAAESDVELTLSDLARRTIAIAEDGLDVTIAGANLTDLYPGESIELKVTMKNTGETAYSDLAVSLPDGSVAASGIDLAPGASYEGTVRYTAAQSGEVSVSVAGKDASGEDVGVVSNAIEVTTQDASQALILKVRAQAQETVMYSEPAVVRFAVQVDNVGETDATTLTVKEGGTTVATIPSLPSGESRTLVFDVQASIAGQFQFTVSGKDGGGKERSYESNIIKIAYVEPTPAPTNTPAPTRIPPTPSPEPTATPVPTIVDRIRESVDPTALYIAAAALSGLILVVLIVSGVRGAKRRRVLSSAIDTIERGSDVRDHRGVRRKSKGKSKDKDKPRQRREKHEDFPPIVPTPELTETPWEPVFPTSEEKEEEPQQAEEGKRRRAAQEQSAEETLRVVPVDQRPDFVPQGEVDDSETRVFSRLRGAQNAAASAETRVQPPVQKAEETPAPKPAAPEKPEIKPEEKPEPQVKEEPAHGAGSGETIRLSSTEVSELTKQRGAADSAAGAKGNTIKTAKPMKKKKKGFFSRRDDEDDFLEEQPDADDEDDFFE